MKYLYFSHGGKLGDVIYSLNFAREMIAFFQADGAKFHLQTEIPMNSVYEPYTKVIMSTAAAECLAPLLRIQHLTLGLMDTGSGLVRGMNRSSISTIVSLLGSCVLRIIWIYTVVAAHPSLVLVYLSYPISWTITGLCHLTVTLSLKKKFVRLAGVPAEEEPAA